MCFFYTALSMLCLVLSMNVATGDLTAYGQQQQKKQRASGVDEVRAISPEDPGVMPIRRPSPPPPTRCTQPPCTRNPTLSPSPPQPPPTSAQEKHDLSRLTDSDITLVDMIWFVDDDVDGDRVFKTINTIADDIKKKSNNRVNLKVGIYSGKMVSQASKISALDRKLQRYFKNKLITFKESISHTRALTHALAWLSSEKPQHGSDFFRDHGFERSKKIFAFVTTDDSRKYRCKKGWFSAIWPIVALVVGALTAGAGLAAMTVIASASAGAVLTHAFIDHPQRERVNRHYEKLKKKDKCKHHPKGDEFIDLVKAVFPAQRPYEKAQYEAGFIDHIDVWSIVPGARTQHYPRLQEITQPDGSRIIVPDASQSPTAQAECQVKRKGDDLEVTAMEQTTLLQHEPYFDSLKTHPYANTNPQTSRLLTTLHDQGLFTGCQGHEKPKLPRGRCGGKLSDPNSCADAQWDILNPSPQSPTDRFYFMCAVEDSSVNKSKFKKQLKESGVSDAEIAEMERKGLIPRTLYERYRKELADSQEMSGANSCVTSVTDVYVANKETVNKKIENIDGGLEYLFFNNKLYLYTGINNRQFACEKTLGCPVSEEIATPLLEMKRGSTCNAIDDMSTKKLGNKKYHYDRIPRINTNDCYRVTVDISDKNTRIIETWNRGGSSKTPNSIKDLLGLTKNFKGSLARGGCGRRTGREYLKLPRRLGGFEASLCGSWDTLTKKVVKSLTAERFSPYVDSITLNQAIHPQQVLTGSKAEFHLWLLENDNQTLDQGYAVKDCVKKTLFHLMRNSTDMQIYYTPGSMNNAVLKRIGGKSKDPKVRGLPRCSQAQWSEYHGKLLRARHVIVKYKPRTRT